MINIMKQWTFFDRCIYFIESRFKTYGDNAEPDVEEMIRIETEYLQKENEKLKKKQFPKALETDPFGQYACPDCHEQIPEELIRQKKKYCPECGRRIMLPYKSYAISHKAEQR